MAVSVKSASQITVILIVLDTAFLLDADGGVPIAISVALSSITSCDLRHRISRPA